MRRQVRDELLDDDLGTGEDIARSLADLRHINAWFGGTRTTVSLIRMVAKQAGVSQLSVLEVGAGAGDVAGAARRALERDRIDLRLSLLDRRWTHLPHNGTPSIAGEALHLPFGDEVFDVVSCSLLAHHFDPHDFQRFAHESLRVCRRAVVINDLIRSRIHLALVYSGLPLFRSSITWHDAPTSVRRAYTIDEMRQMLDKVSARRVEVSSHYLFRMGALLWK